MTSSSVDTGVRVEWLGPANRDAVLELAAHAWDRSRSPAAMAWRYERCPGLEAAVALAGDQCVACVFGMRRAYWTPSGDIECVEPFDWYTREEWRPKGAGLRVMKHLMSGPRPLIAMGGSLAARNLFLRLGWSHFATAYRLALPLSGRFLRHRGRAPMLAHTFELVGRGMFTPRRHRPDPLRVEPAGWAGPDLDSIIETQRRFALVARPELAAWRWLREAPPEMGIYLGFNLITRDRMVGFASARVFTSEGLHLAELLDVTLADHAVGFYPAAVRRVAYILAGFGVDAIYAVTTCPDTLAALRFNRFRLQNDDPLYGWWKGREAPSSALVTSSHAEHAFFPSPTAAESAWAGTSGAS
jgi:hypothetical protein